MKNKIILFTGLTLFLSFSFLDCSRDMIEDSLYENSFTIISTPDLNELATTWAGVYGKINPEVKIEVIEVPGNSITKSLEDSRNLGIISGDYKENVSDETFWKEVIGRDVIVPVFNSKNPFISEISLRGISNEKLAHLLNNPGMTSWGMLLESEQEIPVNLYVLDDASVHSAVAKLLNVNTIGIEGTKVKDGIDLITAVQEDRYSVGVCKIADVIDYSNQNTSENILLLPIDKNGNGKIDFKENIYADLNVFSRGVWIGKYPRALSSNIYSVSGSQPTNESQVAFLKWILTDGQVFLDNHGYANLELNERQAKVKLIDIVNFDTPVAVNDANSKEPLFSNIFFLAMLVMLTIILFLTVLGILLRENRTTSMVEKSAVRRSVLNEDLIQSPPGVYFDITHTWAFMEKDGMVRVGIDDFLQHITGPLTRIKMKHAGEKIRKGKQILSIIQDGKQLDIYSPISGIIKEKNTTLSSNISVINSSPYSEGWIYMIEPTNWIKEIQFLFMGNRYREWLKGEFLRLKDFLTDSLRSESVEYAPVLQDGGELLDRILEDLGPEIWEDFQANFIDVPS